MLSIDLKSVEVILVFNKLEKENYRPASVYRGIWDNDVQLDQQLYWKEIVDVPDGLQEKPQHSTLFGNYDWEFVHICF